MTSWEIALASNYIVMRKNAKSILDDLEKGRERNPHLMCDMFPWNECWSVLKPLLINRVKEMENELDKLGVDYTVVEQRVKL